MFDTSKLTTDSWTEDDQGIGPGGDVGGDIQISDSFSRRFAQRLPDGEFVVIDFASYVASEDENRFEDDVTPEDAWVQTQVNYCHCTDPNDPGSSETYADTRYWDEPEPGATLDDARARCAGLTQEDLSEAVSQMAI